MARCEHLAERLVYQAGITERKFVTVQNTANENASSLPTPPIQFDCGPDNRGCTEEAQQQNSGPGFFSRLGQRFKNWYGDRGFKTDEELDREVGAGISRIVDEPNLIVTNVADSGAIGSVLLANVPLGVVSTAASIKNDPGFLNWDLNGLSTAIPYAIEGSDLPLAYGFAVYDGSQFAGHTLTTVFTPDASQSDTINANGITVQDPQAAFDSGSW
jgi:hypothetical protein